MARRVADQFADILAAAGVRRVYGIVDDSLNGLTDAMRRQSLTLYMVKAVMNGRGDEVIDLARSNLWR
jgi:thiamine pyrophosphate-dependent acetolactate synthase large subunit-like protein